MDTEGGENYQSSYNAYVDSGILKRCQFCEAFLSFFYTTEIFSYRLF